MGLKNLGLRQQRDVILNEVKDLEIPRFARNDWKEVNMGRRKKTIERRSVLDALFHDVVVGKFVSRLMKEGKKSIAEALLYGALDLVKEKNLGKEPLDIFKRALDNVKPAVEVRSRRVGGATYQVPMEVRSERRQALAIRWLITYAGERKGKSMKANLAEEIVDAFNGTGGAIRKKEDVHRMAEANKAFAHYRW